MCVVIKSSEQNPIFDFSGFIIRKYIKTCSSAGVKTGLNPDEHMTYYTVSSFIEQKLRQNTEAGCEKLSEPLLLPQELRV